MKIRLSFLPVVIACLFPLVAIGQNQPVLTQPQIPQLDPNRPAAIQPSDRSNAPAASSVDVQLAACLLLDNQNEIALLQLAVQRAQSDEVKKFAQEEIQEHQQLASTLQKFAGSGGLTSQTTPLGQRQDQAQGTLLPRDAGQIPQQPGQGAIAQADRPAGNVTTFKVEAPPGGGLNPIAFKQELAAQCLQSARKELEQKQGAEFDMCFMGMQVAGHMHMVDFLKVAQNHASSEFRSKLAEAQKTAEKHLEHAKQIAKSQMASAQSGSRPAPSSR